MSLRGRLRRDLGVLESYAALVGILVGAGSFRVTGDAYARTGPSVLLGAVLYALRPRRAREDLVPGGEGE